MNERDYLRFDRADWAVLSPGMRLPFSGEELQGLRGIDQPVAPAEVAEIYLPLARLIEIRIAAQRELAQAAGDFLGRPHGPSPFIIAVAGSIAVGKSSFARVLQAVLSGNRRRPTVALVTTDGFLYPNSVLETRGLMQRKGFPESYDLPSLVASLAALKAGAATVETPIYSHLTYDILPDEKQAIDRPDIVVLEGLNVLQPTMSPLGLASDFVDFSLYLDAETADIEAWFMHRFRLLQQTAFQDPASYFFRYRDVTAEAALAFAAAAWREINLVNLTEHILPTRERADLVLKKRADHAINALWLRRKL